MEAEVFLLGKWKSFEELEENISLPELSATLDALRERDHQDKRFAAGLQGIDLDEGSGNKAEEIKKRGQERALRELQGHSQEEVTNSSFLDFGQAYHVDT